MSEFFFDYKCIAMGEQPKNKPHDKALDFYLFQDYNEEGDSMCVQIYVPKSMQEKYSGAKVYYSVNDVAFPDINNDNLKPALWLCSNKNIQSNAEANYISTDNSIYIKNKEGELSGCGIIAFMEDGKGKPKPNNCYKFVINYAKKEVISYRIVESKGLIKIQVAYPLIRKPMELCVIQKQGAKPVLVKDRENTASKLGGDEKMNVTLKANGRLEDVCKVSFKVEDASKFDYRLAFCNQTDSKHYLLVDESDFTLEDKEARRKERKLKNKVSLSNQRCPYCGGQIIPPAVKYKKGKTMIAACNGKIISEHTEDKKLQGKLTIVCGEDLIKKSGGNLGVNQLILPEDYAEKPSMNVVVAGFPSSGKTIYLSSIFNMQDGGTGTGIRSYPFIFNKILSYYDKKGKGEKLATEVEFNDVDSNVVWENKYENIRSVMDINNIKRRYVIGVGGNVESQTKGDDYKKLSWNPIGYRFGNLGHAFFYDIPGEMFRMSNQTEVRALDMADCILAVINGAKEIKDPVGELLTTLEKIPTLTKSEIDMKNMPIAIVFTKHDLKLTEYVDDDDLDFCFDENCHVVRENIVSLLPKDGVYEGSAIERHIDCSSYELEHYLKARDTEGKFTKIKESYKNIKFFTCSALGSDLCLGMPTAVGKEVLFKPRRLRAELPIIWLMYKKGLIKR